MYFLLFSIRSFLASGGWQRQRRSTRPRISAASGLPQWNSNLFNVITDIGAYHVQASCHTLVGSEVQVPFLGRRLSLKKLNAVGSVAG
jgi:hypothetical protein